MVHRPDWDSRACASVTVVPSPKCRWWSLRSPLWAVDLPGRCAALGKAVLFHSSTAPAASPLPGPETHPGWMARARLSFPVSSRGPSAITGTASTGWRWTTPSGARLRYQKRGVTPLFLLPRKLSWQRAPVATCAAAVPTRGGVHHRQTIESARKPLDRSGTRPRSRPQNAAVTPLSPLTVKHPQGTTGNDVRVRADRYGASWGRARRATPTTTVS